MDCLFCKIIRKEIPNYTVYEDEHVLAFLDIHPCAKGHTVIVPKKHFSNLLDMTHEEWDTLQHGVALTLARVHEVLKPDAENIGINNDEASGQTVPHVHWHIIPRWYGDGGGSIHSIIRSAESIDVKAIAQRFQ